MRCDCGYNFEYDATDIASQIEHDDRKEIERKTSMFSYIGKHWRGELSLAISFWVNLVLINIGIMVFLVWLVEDQPIEHPQVLARLQVGLFLFTTLVVYPWQFFGVWRSASRHIEETGRSGWARTVQLIIVLGLLGTAARFNSDWPVYTQLYQVGFGQDEYGTYVLSLEKDNTILRIHGGLGFGVSRDATEMLRKQPEINAIVLDSIGGWIYEGRQLAELIFMNGLDTISLTGCYSACTIAYIAGNNRYLSPNANLGFHQYQLTGKGLNISKEVEAEQKKDLRLFRRQGIAPEFLDSLFNTPRDDLWYPTFDELVEAGIVHDIAHASDITPTRYQGQVSEADEAILELPLFKTLKKHDPDDYRRITEEMLDLLNNGASVLEAQSRMIPKMSSILENNLPVTSDEALIRFAAAIVEALKMLVKEDPFLCLKYLFPQQYGSAQWSLYFPEESMAAYLDAFEMVIVDAYEKDNPPLDLQAANNTIQNIVPMLEDQAKYMELHNLHTRDDYKKSCNVAIRFYELILAEDRVMAANTLRYMFQADGG